jgi:SpoVK/Ycf46/Vps4 family AAA+-type ATPase
VQALIFKSPVTWDDIGGLDSVKQVFKSAYALALAKQPEGVNLPPWRAILLHGPPGTGKTMLAAAASNGLGATFFNVRISSILSKYFGESSKLVSALYDAARNHAPSVVYIDEFESVGSAIEEGSGPEGRILATLRVELDGLALKGDPRYVLTLASTNEPWKLDRPIVDRFKKRIYVPLPDLAGRQVILDKILQKHGLTSEMTSSELARMTENYSGRELDALCQEAITLMVKDMNPELEAIVDQGLEVVKQYTIRVCPLKRTHFMQALSHIKAKTGKEQLRRFEDWEKSFE